MAEAAQYLHNINRDAHIAALKWELASARTAEHKKAIQAELEAITGQRTVLEDRSGVETRTGPNPVVPPTHVVEAVADEQRSPRHVVEEGR